MRQALDVIAGLLTNGQADALACRWAALRFQHTSAVRAAVADAYAPATANKMLSALRGVLKMAWRLGPLTADDYARATDLPVVRGSSLPAGRELESDELTALLAACAADPDPAGTRDAARSRPPQRQPALFDHLQRGGAAGPLLVRGLQGG